MRTRSSLGRRGDGLVLIVVGVTRLQSSVVDRVITISKRKLRDGRKVAGTYEHAARSYLKRSACVLYGKGVQHLSHHVGREGWNARLPVLTTTARLARRGTDVLHMTCAERHLPVSRHRW